MKPHIEKPCFCDPNPFLCGEGCVCEGCGCIRARPILFAAPMVLALLAGTKSQTRRIFKQRPRKDGAKLLPDLLQKIGVGAACPYGRPGDRLWVKETWRPSIIHSHGNDACDCADVRVCYAADGAANAWPDNAVPNAWTMPKAAKAGNVSPLFMPRWASRLTLDIIGIRIQRLQEISEEDAVAEGVEATPRGWRHYLYPDDPDGCDSARGSFFTLWESINGVGSVRANPWVWPIQFKAVPHG